MQFTVRDVSSLLQVPERVVLRWIQDQGLPASEVQGQVRLNRAELLEWATTHHVPIPGELFRNGEDPAGCVGPPTALAPALRLGGILRDLPGDDPAEVLRALAARIRLPAPDDAAVLCEVLLARERLASTGVGEGFAVPHARHPIVLDLDEPRVVLGFLQRPVDFGAADGLPVHTLLALISPTVRTHLHLLARLGFALQDPGFRATLEGRAPDGAILAAASAVDARLRASGNLHP